VGGHSFVNQSVGCHAIASSGYSARKGAGSDAIKTIIQRRGYAVLGGSFGRVHDGAISTDCGRSI
jgi:hypothetical protein